MNFAELNYDHKKNFLDQLPRKQVILLACDCAWLVLPIWEKECPNDQRPRKAIEMAEAHALTNAKSNIDISYAARESRNKESGCVYWAADAAVDAGLAASTTEHHGWTANTTNDCLRADPDMKIKVNALYTNMILPEPPIINPNIKNLIKLIKQTKDFTVFPILEDALEDVGYLTGRNGVYGLSHKILNLTVADA